VDPLVTLFAFALFLLPIGYTAIGFTAVGVKLLLEQGLGLVEITLLYLLASLVSILLVYELCGLVLQRFRNAWWFKLWFKRFELVASPMRRMVGRFGAFTGLAIGNAVFSQIYMSVLALLLEVPRSEAVAALLVGNVFSYSLALGVVLLGIQFKREDLLVLALGAFALAYLANRFALFLLGLLVRVRARHLGTVRPLIS